ncbi:MAG: sporulation protein YqfD [Clostridia bacterium]|nr:sporulation protein YqfD [Clostridia bacterium]
MFLWKLPRGYAKIESENVRPERIINAALVRGIALHNIKRLGRTSFRAIVLLKQLDALMELAAECGVQIRLIRRGGMPVKAAALLARPALIASVFIAAGALAFLSTRVLAIDVKGWDSLIEAEAERFLKQNGVSLFMPLSAVSKSEISEKLSAFDGRIGSSTVWTDGVVLKVELHSGLPNAAAPSGAPSNIFADKDCVILKLAALEGRPLVKAGDAVKKGQLLVSGNITPEASTETLLTHSSAEILGQVAYRFSVVVDRTELAPAKSGNTEKAIRLKLFSFTFDSNSAFPDEQRTFDSRYALTASFLPVFVFSGRAEELVLKPSQRDADAMIAEALKAGEMLINQKIPDGARMISRDTELVWNADGSLEAVFSIQTVETIGYTELI